MANKKASEPAPGTMFLPPAFIGTASTDKTRAVISGIHIDAEHRHVVATNGRILAALPIPGTETVKPAYITPALWKAAKTLTKNAPLVLDYTAGTLNGLPLPDECPDGTYPNWKQILPDVETAYRLTLDPDYLLTLAASLGRDKDNLKGITLDLPTDYGYPITTRIHGKEGDLPGTGVIMAIRTKHESEGYDGLLATRPEGTAAPAAAPAGERSPGPFAFDRTVMMKDPIAWLKLLNIELRYLWDYTPDGGWIYDYLDVGQIAAKAEALEMEAEAAASDREANEENEDLLKTYEAMLKRIIEALETCAFDSIGETSIALEVIASVLGESDHALAYDYEKVQNLLDRFEKLDPAAGAPAASGDAEAREKLAAANARIALLEAELAQRPSAAAPPERSPAPAAPAPAAPAAKADKPRKEVPAATAPPKLTRNAERNGIELRFDGKPSEETIAALKGHGFRWAPGQEGQPWWVRYSEERWIFATRLAEGGTAQAPAPYEEEPAEMELPAAELEILPPDPKPAAKPAPAKPGNGGLFGLDDF